MSRSRIRLTREGIWVAVFEDGILIGRVRKRQVRVCKTMWVVQGDNLRQSFATRKRAIAFMRAQSPGSR